jgi:phosphoribosylaminoimidazole-succinocarboxamide synthase
VCGIALPDGLAQADQLPEPIFTPATKAETGHDENISFEETCSQIGERLASKLRDISISIYTKASEYARERGIILADTKFEFGLDGDEIVLIDEALTPDSSRYWPADRYEPGQSPFSYDKQFVRDWLETTNWDKNSPPPDMPDEIAAKTRAKYIEAFELLTDETFPWK